MAQGQIRPGGALVTADCPYGAFVYDSRVRGLGLGLRGHNLVMNHECMPKADKNYLLLQTQNNKLQQIQS